MNTPSSLTHDLIRANAGTGKTFQLTNRFLSLILRGHPPDTILATTFTRKAASEIRERVFKRLLEAMNSSKACAELGSHLGLPALALADCERAFLSLLATQHRLRIGTIDALFMEIARLFFIETGLPARWEVSSIADDQLALSEAILTTLEQHQSDDAIGEKASAAILSPLMHHIRPALELARSSSPESWSTPLSLAQDSSINQPLHTFASALAEMPLPMTKGKPPAPNKTWLNARNDLLTQVTSGVPHAILEHSMIKNLLSSGGGFARHPYTEEHRAILAPLANAAASQILADTVARTAELRGLIDATRATLDAIKFRKNSYSFDDIKHILRYAAGRITELDLFFRLDCTIRHLLIDEFQDTSLDQWTVLEPLVTEVLSASPGERTFLVVGDEKQSIYDWRGGTPHLFRYLEERYSSLTAKPLFRSFRSSQAIMTLVNTILERTPTCAVIASHTQVADEWLARKSHHETTLTSEGYVHIERLSKKKSDDSEDSDLSDDATDGTDADAVDKESTGIGRAVELVAEIRASYPTATVGILLRRNKYQPTILAELLRRNIAASGEGGTPLTSSPVVRALLGLLTWIEHPADKVAQFQVTKTPICHAFPELSGPIDERAWLAEQRSAVWRRGIGTYLAGVLARIGSESSDEASLIDHFIDAAYESDATSESPDIDRFLRDIQTRSVSLESQAAVRVMTIHKAKGLEFDAVILLDLESPAVSRRGISFLTERTGPLSPPSAVWVRPRAAVMKYHERLVRADEDETNRALSGQLALLYVAVTRARHALFVLVGDKAPKTSLNELLTATLDLAGGDANKDESSDDTVAVEENTSNGTIAEETNPSPARIVYQIGNAAWYPFTPEHSTPTTITHTVARPNFRAPSAPHRRALLAQSPSTRALTPNFSGVLTESNEAGKNFGTAVHAVCEQITWLTESLELTGDPTAVAYLRDRLTHPAIRAVFDPAHYPVPHGGTRDLWRERPFALRLGGKVISGIFDRVVVVRSPSGTPLQAHLVDFKTDSCTSTDTAAIEHHTATYRPQMTLYRAALATMLGIGENAVRGQLLFLDGGVAVELFRK
jgi:ATP-dependent exoDNAse (exonuclease V) beta subunit